MKRKTRMAYLEVFKDIKEKEVNLRSCDFLFELFLKACNKVKLNWNEEWKEWSKKILTFFAELGKFYSFRVYLRPEYGILDTDNQPTSEYLVDLCWSFEDDNNRAYWLELVLESELSGQNVDSIAYDFWKLTDTKAFMKVGVFAPRLKDRTIVLDKISSLVATHAIKVPTEKYLIILILNHGSAEIESQRIEIAGYKINYLGDLKEIGSKRFPTSP